MDEETFNMSVRKFLKTLGVTAQREIERAVREQLEAGELRGDETLDATATVAVRGSPRGAPAPPDAGTPLVDVRSGGVAPTQHHTRSPRLSPGRSTPAPR